MEDNSLERGNRGVEKIGGGGGGGGSRGNSKGAGVSNERSLVSWTVNVGLPFSTEIQLRYK